MPPITMPKMGFDMEEGTIVRWLKQVGDHVTKGDAIAEIETDKVTIEIEAFASGQLTQIIANDGEVAKVGSAIAMLDGPEQSTGASATPAAAGEEAAKPAQNPTAVAESDAAPQPQQRAAGAGSVEKQPSQAQGEPLRTGYGSDEKPEDFLPGAPQDNGTGTPATAPGNRIEPVQAGADGGHAGPVFASPMAKRMAREQNLTLSMIAGSGPGGRIVRKDVESFAKQPRVAAQPAPASASTAAPAPPTAPTSPTAPPAPQAVTQPSPAGPAVAGTRREPLSRMRQTIARRLTFNSLRNAINAVTSTSLVT
ncbi:MAG: hypothetical protein NVSMB42_12670 [Herpetosiphon sp.]